MPKKATVAQPPMQVVLTRCRCRLRKWNEEKQEFYWLPVNNWVTTAQLKKRCFLCGAWREPIPDVQAG